MTPREDVQPWINLSAYDLETAKAMLESGRYLYVLFTCQRSYAAGRPGPYSDIDLAVFSPDIDDWTVEQRIDLAVDVKLNYSDVELHVFSVAALENARPSNFYGHILETGKRVA